MEKKFKVITIWIVKNDQWEILLWKRSLTENAFPGFRSIPWWKVEINWTQSTRNILEDNLKKEYMEEIWIEIWEFKYLSSHYWFNNWEFKLYIAFSAKHLSWIPQALEDTDYVKYFDVESALKLQLPPNIDVLLKQSI